jgi:deoxycytidine triphosphate deaminase
MFLNKDEIEKKQLVHDAVSENYRNASYDLSIVNIIDMDGKSWDEYKLLPQGMIYVVFRERVVLPGDIIGFAHVKTSVTRNGIMATHIGIIDPYYNGFISTLLINFGNTECRFSKGKTALRLTFAPVLSPVEPNKPELLSFEKYVEDTKDATDHLDEKFLNLNSVEKEVLSSLIKRVFSILAIFGVAGFFVSVYFQFKNSNQGEIDRAIKRFELQVNTLQEKNNQLEQRLNSLNQGVYLKSDSGSKVKNNDNTVEFPKKDSIK